MARSMHSSSSRRSLSRKAGTGTLESVSKEMCKYLRRVPNLNLGLRTADCFTSISMLQAEMSRHGHSTSLQTLFDAINESSDGSGKSRFEVKYNDQDPNATLIRAVAKHYASRRSLGASVRQPRQVLPSAAPAANQGSIPSAAVPKAPPRGFEHIPQCGAPASAHLCTPPHGKLSALELADSPGELWQRLSVAAQQLQQLGQSKPLAEELRLQTALLCLRLEDVVAEVLPTASHSGAAPASQPALPPRACAKAAPSAAPANPQTPHPLPVAQVTACLRQPMPLQKRSQLVLAEDSRVSEQPAGAWRAVGSFSGASSDYGFQCLSLATGDVVTKVDHRENGEWQLVESGDRQGWVPNAFLEPVTVTKPQMPSACHQDSHMMPTDEEF